MPDTADGIFHTHRIYAMTRLMQAGNLYPRWVPWFHLGYGYPVFNYYAPLATWLGGLLGLAGISAPLAFQMVTAVSWLAGSVGMTALARRFLPDTAALAAAALWVYAPTRMHEYWIQGSLSHIVATALVPWVLLTLVNLIAHPTRRKTLYFGVAVGLLMLAHQPTTYLTALYAGGTGLAVLAWRAYRRHGQVLRVLLHAGMGLLVALGIAAVLLLPLLFEIDAIVINDTPTGNIPALLETNTISLPDLFMQPRPMDLTDQNATIPHTYGLLPGVLGLVGLAALLLKRSYALAALLAVGVGVSLFLATPASLDVWHSLPLMDQLRFPWRVLRIGIVPLSLLAAASVRLVPDRWTIPAGGGIIALAIFAALPTLYPTGRTVDFSGQTAADMIRYEISSGALGGTSYDEFKPVWSTRTPRDVPADMTIYETEPLQLQVTDSSGIQLERINPTCWRVTADTDARLVFHQFYFPGWQATLDGQTLPLEVESPYGLLRVPLPRVEDATLCLNYVGTDLQRIAGGLTLMTWGLVIGLWITGGRHSAEAPPDVPSSTLSPRWMSLAGGLLLVGALLNGLWIGPHTDWFRLQSPPDAPYYMATPVQTTFTQGYDLLGYTLHDLTTGPGQTLSVTLYWRPLPGTDGSDYYPVVQFANLSGTTAWASAELPYIGSTPHNHTPDRFISQRVDLAAFDDVPPYVGQIDVRLVDRQTGDWVPLADDSGDHVVLPDVIPITGTQPPVTSDQTYLIADAIALVDANIKRQDGFLSVDLVWNTRASLPLDDVKLFIHELDSTGRIVQQIDGAPFGGDYPARYWRPDQTLTETYRLPDDEEITRIAIGMYTAELRLPVTLGGQPMPDGRILIDVP